MDNSSRSEKILVLRNLMSLIRILDRHDPLNWGQSYTLFDQLIPSPSRHRPVDTGLLSHRNLLGSYLSLFNQHLARRNI